MEVNTSEREMEKYFICSWLTGGAYHNMGKCLFCWKNDSAREKHDGKIID